MTDGHQDHERLEVERRLIDFLASSGAILGSPNVDEVLSATIMLARDVFAADGYALWRAGKDGSWRMARSFGISDQFAARVITGGAGQAPRTVPFSEPMVVRDVAASPMLHDMRDAYVGEGVASMIVFPLSIRNERVATLVFYSRQRRDFAPSDVKVGIVLANLAGAALTTAELYEEQQQAREAADHARERALFLAKASSALSASLDYESTLRAVARLAVPAIADWCAVDILDNDGAVQRLAVAHVNPQKVELAHELQRRYPPDPNAAGGVHQVIRTGEPVLVPRIPPELIANAARDDAHRRILEELKLTSYICVPMIANRRSFGAITFVSAESGREYTEADMPLANELAARASLAVENARSYRAATEASRIKDEFLATLSHELRTPLGSVLTYARMLRAGMIKPVEAERVIETIERNALSLKQMIEDVLDVSSIEAGRLRLDVQTVQLPEIVREAAATVKHAADAKGVRVELIMDPITDPVFADPSRLQQIVWNLLSNAIKFTPRDGKVQVRLARINSHVEISVSDTGIGIAADFLPFVFEKFRQADGSFSRRYGGMGLGLAIAKQLTELHGGRIVASSGGEGHGATFTVVLPLMIIHPHRDAAPRHHPRADGVTTGIEALPRLDGLRLLAIDDDADSLALMTSVLESAGATVLSASSGEAGLRLLETHAVDAIVSDIGMPGMDGFQFVRAVRQMNAPAGRTPAAALTAYARSQDRVTALASGYQLHLVKPIDPLELVVAVSALARHTLDTP